MCNSWMWKVETPPPSRWLEECLAEAFSIRRLAHLADAWERDPPFTGDRRYGRPLRDYRRDLIEKYQKAGGPNRSKTSRLGYVPIGRYSTAPRAWAFPKGR
jgi:hypothetical protein